MTDRNSPAPLLQIEGLTKRYGSFVAVRDLSLHVDGGEIVGLLGPNGAGKTTTIRCIASIIQPTSGRIAIGGEDLVQYPEKAKRSLAYVPEQPNPYEMLTCWSICASSRRLRQRGGNGSCRSDPEAGGPLGEAP